MTEKTKKFEVLIGADPELFVFDSSNKKFVSAHDLVPGTKEEPLPVPRGAVQVDGVAAEFNILPAKTQKEFLGNINRVRTVLELIVKDKNPNYRLVGAPTAKFDQDYFDNLPDEVKVLGCQPDYNAYTGGINRKPGTDQPFRSGGGHIHIGFLHEKLDDPFTLDHMRRCGELVRELDFTLMHTSREWDFDIERKKLYGDPGSFRPKSYGVEYRPLSNAWLNQKWSTTFVYDTVKAVTCRWLQGYYVTEAAGKMKVRTTDDLIEFSKFMYSQHLPPLDQYSPRLEALAMRRAQAESALRPGVH